MLFFMGAASHLPLIVDPEKSKLPLLLAMVVIIGALQVNALYGKTGPMTTVRGVIHSGIALTAILYVAVIFLV